MSVRLPVVAKSDPVAYLVGRKFPGNNWREIYSPSSGVRVSKPAVSPVDRIVEMQAYDKELRALPKDQLDALLKAEREKDAAEQKAARELEEAGRFYNQYDAKADVVHWAKQAYWTIDEAVALSFGKDPRTVTWKRLESTTLIWSFSKAFQDRRDIFQRAAAMGQLFDSTIPTIFLAWAKRMDIAIPQDLTAEIERLGLQVGDWKSLYDQATEKLQREYGRASTLHNQLAAARAELAATTTALETETRKLGTRERDSLLKLVGGMAAAFYGFDPKAAKSPIPKEISDELARVGIEMSDDTVRKWLKEAAEFLPQTTD